MTYFNEAVERKSERKTLGTPQDDVLTGTKRKDRIRGYGGDDRIESGEGKDKAWGGRGDDVFVTVDGGKGYVTIMDFGKGDDVIEFCGCASTQLVQKGKHVKIIKGDDIKAVVRNVETSELEIDFFNREITLIRTVPSDLLA